MTVSTVTLRLQDEGAVDAVAEPASDGLLLAGPTAVGLVTILVFFAGFCGWAAFAGLSSAAIAPGVVVVDSERKTVKHLDGGIVKAIHIGEGRSIKAGDLLIALDDVQARARLEQLRLAQRARVASQARLEAERDLLDAIRFPQFLLDEGDDPRIAAILTAQMQVFEARHRSRVGKVNILNQQIAQSRQEIEGLRLQIAADNRQLELIDDEIADAETLFAKGLSEKPRVLALKRRKAEIEGSLGRNTSGIAQVEKSIGETEVRIVELATAQVTEAAETLQKVEAELNELGERLPAAEDVVRRTEIRAPVKGRVIDLKVHTVGGVIGPGEALMDIVPAGERLVVNAEIDPSDIDVVTPGLPARVRMVALPYRHAAPLDGRVISVSADSMTDERTRKTYYLARIELSVESAGLRGGMVLQPGMQAEAIIETGTNTLLDYLVGPISQAVARGMREQ